jgi:glycosyltransferase involved in cell wall biosynthesis
MRVGFVTYGIDRGITGVGRVALEIGRELLRRPDVEPFFLTPYRRGPFVDRAGARSYHLPGCRLLPGLMLLGPPLIALAAARLRLDVVHDPIGVSPFMLGRWAGRFRRLVTVHDAIAFEYPGGYPLLNNLLHTRYVPWTLANVDGIATVTEHARRALTRHLAVPFDRISVIPNGVSPAFRPVPVEEARAVAARHGLHRPYLLYVGAFQARKNVLRLVEAFERVRPRLPGMQLALAGPVQWRYPELAASLARASTSVQVLGYVSDDDLPALYSAAEAFVLPSLYEGFGIPVLEAMACGTPVLCSNSSSLPEVAADAALLFDPLDVAAIGEAIVRVGTDRSLADDLRWRGARRACDFSWERAADEYASLYRRLLM